MSEPGFDPYKPPVDSEWGIQGMAALAELVKAWEKLRMLYNAIMILPGLGVLALWISRTSMPWPVVLIFGLATGIAANGAFFAGPLAELYIRGLFRGGEIIGKGRWLIFSAGLVVSAGVIVVAAMIPILWPG